MRGRVGLAVPRRAALAALPLAVLGSPARPQPRFAPLARASADAAPVLERMRNGGLVLFVRHADTLGEPCDRSFRVGGRAGQRNISARGRAQSRLVAERLEAAGVPVGLPVLAGPVYRARQVVDGLLADDFSGPRLDWVLGDHRSLVSAPVPAGTNRVLVGHRTPAILVVGVAVAGRAFPEGSVLVLEPRGERGSAALAVVKFAPIPGGGFHGG